MQSTEDITGFIATLHGDCHDHQDVKVLMNHSDLWIRVNNNDYKNTSVIKFHPKGKVETFTYDLKVENEQLVSGSVPLKTKPASISNQVEEESSSTPSSSFNLTLSEKEKEDRSKVEMPFWKKSDAKIDYVPDENDDWDDEDPDDDLDF